MRQILSIGLLLTFLNSFGQSDRLQPVRDYLNIYDHERDYYPHIYNHLIKGLSLTPTARVVVLPSFYKEHVISIEPSDKEYVLVFKTCTESIWTSENREKVKTETHEINIDSSFAILIGKVYFKATSEVKYPFEPNWRNDVTSYIITTFTTGQGIQTGETWSPKQGTRMRQLVDIADKLVAMTTAKPADKEKLKNEIQVVANDFLKVSENGR